YDRDQVDSGLERAALGPPPLSFAEPYLVFVHSTSWPSKIWPEHFWRSLTGAAIAAGLAVVLPWGDEAERERALRITGEHRNAFVLPQLSITEKASIIARARATVGLDTGLSHVAAAFNVPSVTLYGATDPLLVGATGKHQTHLVSQFECVGCHETKCTYEKPAQFKPACFVELTPKKIWDALEALLVTRHGDQASTEAVTLPA